MCQPLYPIVVDPTLPSKGRGTNPLSLQERVWVRSCFVIISFSGRRSKIGHPSFPIFYFFSGEDKGWVHLPFFIFLLPLFFLAGQMKKSDHLPFGRKLVVVFYRLFSILHN